MRIVRFRKAGEPASPPNGLAVATESAARDGGRLTLFKDPATSRPAALRIVEGTSERDVALDAPPCADPRVDLFPSGDILIVESRAPLLNGAPYPNAAALSPTGALLRQFTLGDGVEHVFVDDRSRIWVGYFDEGVFGNLGWAGPSEGPRPIGAAGLVCFDAFGAQLWQAPGVNEPPHAFIASAYRLNVQGGSASLFYYFHYAILEASEELALRKIETDLEGCGAFARHDDAYLFTHGHQDPETTGWLGRVVDGRLIAEPVRFEASDAALFDRRDRFVGRGSLLHHFGASGWHVADIREAS